MAKFDKIQVLQKIGATGMVPVYYNADWKADVVTFDLHADEELMKGNVMTEYEERFSSQGNPICSIN